MKHSKHTRNNSSLANAVKISMLAGMVTLAGCASLPPHPELEALQTRYEIMSGQTYANQEASGELIEAREALALGREAYEDNDDDELAHYIVVADKSLDIAEARIELYETRTQIASATQVRENLLREAREREVAIARAEIRSAEADARAAQNEAARTGAALSAEQQRLALREAEIRDQELQIARKDAELAAKAAELEAAERKAQLLADELEEVSMVINERGTILVLSDIMFDFDSAAIKPASSYALGKIADFLIGQDTSQLTVEGHTDSLGTETYNLVLSRDRARAVVNALVDRGVPRERISMDGYGEEYPVASNATEAGRQLNRRVEIVLDDKVGRPLSSRF